MNIENRELSKKLIDTIEELRLSINTISVYDFNIYSSMELYYTIAKKLNEVIEECYRFEVSISEEVVKQNECLQFLLNDGLMAEVVKKINSMISDGTMNSIINNQLLTSINSKITNLERLKATKDELATERARIDSLSSLTSGSTTGDAELIDGRISIEGETYSNIGNAIRGQITNVNANKLDKEDLIIENKFDVSTMITDKYVQYGYVKPYTGWNLSDYIPVIGGKKYSLFTIVDGVKSECPNIYMDMYDYNKNYISNSSYNGCKLSDVLIKDNCKYIRVSTRADYMNSNTIITLAEHTADIKTYIGYGSPINKFNYKFEDISNEIEKCSNVKAIEYNRVVESIARLGYDVYNGTTPPQQSIPSYQLAYDLGFRTMLCDLRFTSDNKPVLFHDDKINTYALKSDGSSIANDVVIADNTLSTLNQYDYGRYKGGKYIGTKIMQLKDILKFCREKGCNLIIEVKAMNPVQGKIATDLVKAYKMSEKTKWSGTEEHMKYVIQNDDTACVSTMPQNILDSTIEHLNLLKTGKNKVFFFAWDTCPLNAEVVNKLIANDIEFYVGTLDGDDTVKNYFLQGDSYYYCTGVSSNKTVAGKVLLEKSR